MKKTIILGMAALLALPLASCSVGKKSNDFKNYSFKETLTAMEFYGIMAIAKGQLNDVQEVVTTYVETTNVTNRKVEETTKANTHYYSNAATESKSTITTKGTVNGVSVEEKTTNEILTFYESGSKLTINRVINSKTGNSYNVYEAYKSADEFNETMNNALYQTVAASVMSLYNQMTFGKIKNGWQAVYSNIAETHTQVPFENSTKEQVVIERTQIVLDVNQNKQITKLTRYSDTLTNRDPNLAWYKSNQKTESETLTYEFKYGSRSSTGAIDSVVSEFNSGYLLNYGRSIAAYAITENEDHSYALGNTLSVSTVAYENKRTSAKDVHVEVMIYITGTVAENQFIGLQINANVTSKASLSAETSYSKTIQIESADGGTSVEVSANKFVALNKMYKGGSSALLSYDLSYASGESAGSISNAKITAFAPIPVI